MERRYCWLLSKYINVLLVAQNELILSNLLITADIIWFYKDKILCAVSRSMRITFDFNGDYILYHDYEKYFCAQKK
jgi:hypothetical protein